MKYYFYASLPIEIRVEVMRVRRKWQWDDGTFDPHLTVVKPRILLPGKTETDLINTLNIDFLGNSFPVELANAGFFGNYENIHISVKRTPGLVTCHDQLLRVTDGILASDRSEFIDLPGPHFTLFNDLLPEKGKKIWNEIKTMNFSHSYFCHVIHLLKREDKGRWERVYQIGLL